MSVVWFGLGWFAECKLSFNKTAVCVYYIFMFHSDTLVHMNVCGRGKFFNYSSLISLVVRHVLFTWAVLGSRDLKEGFVDGKRKVKEKYKACLGYFFFRFF